MLARGMAKRVRTMARSGFLPGSEEDFTAGHKLWSTKTPCRIASPALEAQGGAAVERELTSPVRRPHSFRGRPRLALRAGAGGQGGSTFLRPKPGSLAS
mgnify:CR=1 FL=1